MPALVLIKLVLHPLLVWAVLSAAGDFGAPWTHAAIVRSITEFGVPPTEQTEFRVAHDGQPVMGA